MLRQNTRGKETITVNFAFWRMAESALSEYWDRCSWAPQVQKLESVTDIEKASSSRGSLGTVPLSPSGDSSYMNCGFQGLIGIYSGKHRKVVEMS